MAVSTARPGQERDERLTGVHYPSRCLAAISQKSQNVYQNFKLLKTTKGPSGPNGSQYYLAEFK